jgi:hypothetical protein
MRGESLEDLIKRLEELELEETRIHLERSEVVDRIRRHSGADQGFRVGSRVVITNRVKPLTGSEVKKGDRIGVVTRIDGEKVFFTTLSGATTWRLRKNLRLE